jgi:hypothetical protein
MVTMVGVGAVSTTPSALGRGSRSQPYHHLSVTAKSALFNRSLGVIKHNEHKNRGSSENGRNVEYTRIKRSSSSSGGGGGCTANCKQSGVRAVGKVALNVMR